MCTEQQIYISALSRLQERADISAVRYTNLNGIVLSIFCKRNEYLFIHAVNSISEWF